MNFGIMTCQYSFIDCKNYITKIVEIDNGGDSVWGRLEGIWEVSVPSAHFCCEPGNCSKK